MKTHLVGIGLLFSLPLFALENIKMPSGFSISTFADVPQARSLTQGAPGYLYVGTRADKVFAVVDSNQDGKIDRVITIASELRSPNGVAYKNGDLYVAEISRLLRFKNIEKQISNPAEKQKFQYEVVGPPYPKDAHHGWKYIAFGPDDFLYVPVGAPCNICKPELPYASLTRFKLGSSQYEVFARGIRNTVGFDWDPLTKQIWFTDNGRDLMGDDKPFDELNHAPRAGLNFGYPFCHNMDLPDPEFGSPTACKQYTPNAQNLGPHVAALGMKFYTGKMFPASYQNQIFIAEHGSWNRSTPLGYRISLVRLSKDRKPLAYEVFAEGWLQKEKVFGRPVDLLVDRDGALLVSDDYAGKIYRISYSNP